MRILLTLLIFLLASIAEARKITIVQASRVELRQAVPTPDGSSQEYYVIVGSPAIIQIDEDEITAERIEYNKTTRKMRIVGTGIFQGKNDTVAGRDFEVDLESEGLSAADVFIATKEIDVVGISCERLPGQVSVENGYFSPCSRCGTASDAYGFKAGELTLYPGDRIVARNVTILLAGAPVMYLPIVVMFLSEPSRYPRLQLASDLGVPGTNPNIGLDLPFSVGDNGFGYWLLRYFAGRSPVFGFGLDVGFSNLGGYSNKARGFFLLLPPQSGTELQLAYQLRLEDMRLPLFGTLPEDRFSDIVLNLNLSRADNGTSQDLRGLTLSNQQAVLDFSLKWSAARFNINSQNFDPALFNLELVGNAIWQFGAGKSNVTQYRPELRLTAGTPLLFGLGGLRLSNLALSLGYINSPVDAQNPSAVRLAGSESASLSALRFRIQFATSFEQVLPSGGRINANASFAGQYYSTRNPSTPSALDFDGELERNVVFGLNATFAQSLGGWFEFGLSANYDVARGESPFAFDRVPNRDGAGGMGTTLTLRPLSWLSLGFSQRYGFGIGFRGNEPNFFGSPEPLGVSLTLSPAPIQFGLNFSYNLGESKPSAYDVRLSNSGGTGISFSVAFGYNFAGLGTFQDLKLGVGYATANRAFSLGVNLEQRLADSSISALAVNTTLILGNREQPVTLTFNQNFIPAQITAQQALPSRLSGSLGLRYTFASDFERPLFSSLAMTLSNSYNYTPFVATGSNTPASSLSLQTTLSGSSTLGFTFSSNLDLLTFEAFNPRFSLEFTPPTGSSFEVALGLRLDLPNRNNGNLWRWDSLSLRFGWDVRAGLSVFGDLTYSRQISAGVFSDTFSVRSLGFALAFAVAGSQRPNLFLVATVAQDFTFKDTLNPTLTPLQPAFQVILDQCCYSLVFRLAPDKTSKAYVFSLTLSLPYGDQSLITIDKDNLRLPVVPFLPAIPAPKP
jgi:hypothetical protein